jgi:hypothetical protein
MNYDKGDRVKFLNDIGGGIITEMKDYKTAMVMTTDGFEMPVPVAELILVEKASGAYPQGEKDNRPPGEAGSEEQKGLPDEPESGRSTGIFFEDTWQSIDSDALPAGDEGPDKRIPERNLLFAFVDTGVHDQLDTWLINDSSYNVLYSILMKQDEVYSTLRAGMIGADTKIFIRTFSREDINAFVTFRIQAIFFQKMLFNPPPPSQKEFSVDPAELYGTGYIAANDFFDEKAGIIPVFSDPHEREIGQMSRQEVNRIISENRQSSPSGKKENKKAIPGFEEVDLHIEELVEDHSALSGREVLDIQISRFTTALEGAIRGRTQRIVFIHGIGNGKLKFEIRKTLDKKYPRLKYQDASFEEYGYGATMVIIRK